MQYDSESYHDIVLLIILGIPSSSINLCMLTSQTLCTKLQGKGDEILLKVTARSHSVAVIVIIARRGKSLRMITKRKKAVKRSKYKGVSWNKASSKWVAQKTVKGKNHHIGYFTTALAAARKVNAFCKSQGIALANNLPVPKKKTRNGKKKRTTQQAASCAVQYEI